LTANDIVSRVAGRNDWNPRTVKTLLNRLVKKRALGFESEGKRYQYFPRVTREQCVRSRSQSFLSRVLDGAVGPMLAHFVNETSLSPEEIRELRKILEDRDARAGKGKRSSPQTDSAEQR
jgi:BlaI family penicillinase repressor